MQDTLVPTKSDSKPSGSGAFKVTKDLKKKKLSKKRPRVEIEYEVENNEPDRQKVHQ